MRYDNKRKSLVVLVMLVSVVLVTSGLIIDFAAGSRSERWSHLSLGMASTGFLSGLAAYVVSRFH